jgi:hypothetical protein
VSHTDTLNASHLNRNLISVPTIFFLSPLLTAAIPKLTWLFLFLIALAVILPVCRRIDDWREFNPSEFYSGIFS